VLTFPECGHSKLEIMPTAACQFFFECKTMLRPKLGTKALAIEGRNTRVERIVVCSQYCNIAC
jgi:hypothetical protein